MGRAVRDVREEERTSQIVEFGVGSGRFGIPVERVREMTSLGHLDRIAGAPPWIAGVIRLREEILPVVDLRLRLGLPSLEDERRSLLAELTRCREWHSGWVERVLAEGPKRTGVAKASDRDLCDERFWTGHIYDEVPRLRQIADRAHANHDELHAAIRDMHCASGEEPESTMSDLLAEVEIRAASFDLQIEELQRQVSEGTRPMVIVVTVDDVCTCLQVDRVHSVVSFRDAQRSPAPLGSLVTSDGTQLVSQVVKTEKDPRVVQVLDVDNLLTAAPRPAP
ncbi:MAG: chemotaxis protein CheW [Myxococcota bacterium]